MMLKMKLMLIVIAGIGLLAAQAEAEETPALKTKMDRVSYATGAQMGRGLKSQGVEFEMELVIKGFRDGFAGEKLLLSDEELHAVINAFQAEMRRKQIEMRHKQAKVAGDNKKEGEAFLASNKTKEGVVNLPSGLQYKILKAGDGRKPTESETVEVNYRGTLINGTEFDSSYKSGQPATFKVSAVIPGMREALKLMPVGSKWQLFIPPDLAYGTRGSGRIPPNSALVFEVELVAIR